MKKILSGFAFAGMLAVVSCASSESNMKSMSAMKDSVFAAYPQVASVTVNVENGSDLQIALGSEALYNADPAERRQVAGELTAMALRIFGKEAHLHSGRVLVTRNETNQEAEPKNALMEPMNFEKK
ncbi:hypothetical protein [Rurimicrobium arvi]|uniref:BON domain-containing protein n=1 Tax=Rurimicrobium arvi TaxID=2049916 RepID=A0ABP8MQM0_9BACT